MVPIVEIKSISLDKGTLVDLFCLRNILEKKPNTLDNLLSFFHLIITYLSFFVTKKFFMI